MPGGDRTGPRGGGPLTGGGFGHCGGSSDLRRSSRVGFGFPPGGFGRGRGRRNRFWTTGLPGWQRSGSWNPSDRLSDLTTEKRELQREVDELEAELGRLRARIQELERTNSG
jgi:hypothetical protein